MPKIGETTPYPDAIKPECGPGIYFSKMRETETG
jgi:hypothetical protein